MQAKIKVLHTMTWLAPGGGVDNNVYLTIRGHLEESKEKNFDVHLASGGEIHHNLFEEISGMKFFVCHDLIRPISPLKDFKALIYFIKLIRREKYDIVHTHEAKASLITRLAAYFAGCKHIIYGLHGVTFNDPHSPLKRKVLVLVEKFTVWMVDHIVSVSQSCIDEYHKENIGKKIPATVVHSGIDISKFISPQFSNQDVNKLRDDLGILPDEKVLINIGRFSVAKGQIDTLIAFKEVLKKYPNTKCLFIGEGQELENCREFSKTHGFDDRVIFYGFSDNIPLMLALADVMVLTSHREGLPRVVVEASLCKVPSACFQVEGVHEIIQDNESGFIVQNRDQQKLAERICEYLSDSSLRQDFAGKAFKHVKINWDYNIMVSKLKTLYLDLVKGSKK